MLDAQNAVAAPAAIRREDYRPPEWLVPEIGLELELGAEKTVVRATLRIERAPTAEGRTLRLNGDGLVPSSLRISGDDGPEWRKDGYGFVIGLRCDGHMIQNITKLTT